VGGFVAEQHTDHVLPSSLSKFPSRKWLSWARAEKNHKSHSQEKAEGLELHCHLVLQVTQSYTLLAQKHTSGNERSTKSRPSYVSILPYSTRVAMPYLRSFFLQIRAVSSW